MNVTESPFFSKLRKCADTYRTTLAAIELTNRCNAGCEYCFINKNEIKSELSTLQLHQVIDKLDEANILMVNLTGGELFLREDILEILEHLFECNFFYISIYTNGTALKEEHLSLLEKHRKKIYPLRMTVFSHDQGVHDSYMKIPGSLQTIISNGKRLMLSGVKVHLAIPALTENYETLSDSVSFFNSLGFTTGINLVKLITCTNYSETITGMASEDFYYSLIKNLKNKGIIVGFPSETKDNQLCRGLKTSIMIDTNGDIHPCTVFRNFIIGSIFESTSLNELLKTNIEYNKLRSITKDDLFCAECCHRDRCSPCLARHHSQYHTLEGPYPSSCNLTKAIYKSTLSNQNETHC